MEKFEGVGGIDEIPGACEFVHFVAFWVGPRWDGGEEHGKTARVGVEERRARVTVRPEKKLLHRRDAAWMDKRGSGIRIFLKI